MPDANYEFERPWSPLVWDVNNDGVFTVTDIGLWLENAFFLPGDWAIWLTATYAPDIGRFFEVGVSDYGSTFSALVSVFIWLALARLRAALLGE